MTNILIANSDIDYVKKLMMLINNTFDNGRVYNITFDGKETLEFLNNKDNIDIVLLDLEMPIYNGDQIIYMLSKEKKEKYKNSFIVLEKDIEYNLNELMDESVIYKVLPKTINTSEIIQHIQKLIEYKIENKVPKVIRKKIVNEINYLGYKASYKGTHYLIETIYNILADSNKHIDNLKKDVYPNVARMYNESVNNIKSNINRATEEMYCNCKSERLKEYFLYYEDIKPSVKTVIFTIINKIS